MKGYKRKRGKIPNTWQLAAYVGTDIETGKKKYVTRTFRGSERDADRALAKLVTEVSKGEYVPPSHETVAQYLEFWLENYAKINLRLRTFESYHMIVREHIIPRLGHLPLDKLKPEHLLKYYKEKLANGKLDRRKNPTKQPLSARTVRYHHRMLHKALGDAVKWGKLKTNPTDQVDPPKPIRAKLNVLTPEQVAAFLAVAVQDRLYPLYLAALSLGMRRGELFGLRWQDVDLEASTVRVVQQLVKPGLKPIFGPTKSEHSRRLVKMPAELAQELRKWRIRQLEERLHFGSEYVDYDLVFCQPNGRPLDHGSTDRWSFKPLLKEINLTGVRFHDLRHSSATLLLSQGVHPKIVQERLGHSSITLTMDTYSHVVPSMQNEAAFKWDEFRQKSSDIIQASGAH